MQVYAIGDLHLSGSNPKPMDIFGQRWNNHWEKIKNEWREIVTDEDLVIIPGDISWAMAFDDAFVDLEEIHRLPGTKVLVRGNHDYWWASATKMRGKLPASIKALQNDSVTLNEVTVCGSRGWMMPGEGKDEDVKIYARELMRMEMSLKSARREENGKLIVAMHFPPFNESGDNSEFTELFEKYRVDTVVFGHIHNLYERYPSRQIGGVQYELVSCDSLDFKPLKIFD